MEISWSKAGWREEEEEGGFFDSVGEYRKFCVEESSGKEDLRSGSQEVRHSNQNRSSSSKDGPEVNPNEDPKPCVKLNPNPNPISNSNSNSNPISNSNSNSNPISNSNSNSNPSLKFPLLALS